MTDTLMLRGVVTSGRGNAGAVIRGNMTELRSVLGVDLVQGSLNLVLHRPVMLAPDTAVPADLGKRLFWPALIGDIAVWAYRWPHAPLHILEIVAPVRLRDVLKLADGDSLAIEVRREHTVPLTVVAHTAWLAWWYGRERWYYSGDVYKNHARRWCRRFAATQPGISRER